MMPHLQATIVRQANKTKSLVEVPVGIDGYQDLLPPEERCALLGAISVGYSYLQMVPAFFALASVVRLIGRCRSYGFPNLLLLHSLASATRFPNPVRRAMALSGALGRHIDSAAEVAHLMYLREHQRAHKIEMRRFNTMQGYTDRTLPVPHLYEVLW